MLARLLVLRDHKEFKERLAQQVPPEKLDLRVPLVIPEPQEKLDLRVPLVIPEQQE
jgi:hypothetical protein